MSTSTTMYETRPGPAHNRARPTYTHLAEHLKENPGQWFSVRNAPNHNAAASAAYQIKTGKRAAFRPAGKYDAYSTGTEVIARYIGEPCHTSPMSPGIYCSTCGEYNPNDEDK